MQLSVHLSVPIMGPALLQTHAAVQLDGLEALVKQVYYYLPLPSYQSVLDKLLGIHIQDRLTKSWAGSESRYRRQTQCHDLN